VFSSATAATMTGRITLQRDGREKPLTLARQPRN